MINFRNKIINFILTAFPIFVRFFNYLRIFVRLKIGKFLFTGQILRSSLYLFIGKTVNSK
jgi:hypothetical protein